jgi:sortase (surface protein transpeptidase)
MAVVGVLLGCAALAGAVLDDPARAQSHEPTGAPAPADPQRFTAGDERLAIPEPLSTAVARAEPESAEVGPVAAPARFDTDGPATAATPTSQTTATPQGSTEPRVPERVVIPDISVDAELVELGLDEHGAMELPDFGFAGWYAEGPAPGEDGPAVIVAHVDDQRGPDVFFELQHLELGAEISVPAADGSVATFVVTGMEVLDKEALPVDRIWGPTEGPGLTLITCGGEFDRRTGHYESNVIVYTAPA